MADSGRGGVEPGEGRAGAERPGADPAEPTFADVLNNMFLEPGKAKGSSWWGRRGRHEATEPEPAPKATSAAPRQTPQTTAEPAPDEWTGWDESVTPEGPSVEVRPYARTGGRTAPVHDLAVEALVVTTRAGQDETAIGSVEHVAIARLCQETHSVAEVSALLRMPLGVARVLLSDMVDSGLVDVHRNPTAEDGFPEPELLERVLAGLRKL